MTLSSPTTTRPTDWAVCRMPLGVIRGTPASSINESMSRAKLLGSIQPPRAVVNTRPVSRQASPTNAASARCASRWASSTAAVAAPKVTTLSLASVLSTLSHGTATLNRQLLHHPEPAALGVEVLPAQAEHLSPAQSVTSARWKAARAGGHT